MAASKLATYRKGTFVVYDLETYTDPNTNVVHPYMLGFIIAK